MAGDTRLIPNTGPAYAGQYVPASPDQHTFENDRNKTEWWCCDRCGWYYPRAKVQVQNGRVLCIGPLTHNCVDLPGHAANMLYLDIPYEQRPEPLPNEDVDL